MRKLVVFNHVSLDGYFVDARGDMSWAHEHARPDPEWDAFGKDNAGGDSTFVFGRVTYEMMAKHWPTPAAKKEQPEIAKAMNERPKIVFSRKLEEAGWQNTTLIKGDPVAEVVKLKAGTGPTMVIMGSGTIVAQLTAAGLIDAYQLVVNPVVLGAGRTMFEDRVKDRLRLTLDRTRAFKNGNVVLWYRREA